MYWLFFQQPKGPEHTSIFIFKHPSLTPMIEENVYGNAKRLKWMLTHIRQDLNIVELGCGTGYMICLPLAKMGYSIQGLDLDEKSIAYGKKVFQKEGLDHSLISQRDISSFGTAADVIIASEVFEHMKSDEIKQTLNTIKKNLPIDGRLLVTVPNGYGWFELENFLWKKLKAGQLLEWVGFVELVYQIKKFFLAEETDHPPHPSTLSDSPHIQHFTVSTIQNILKTSGFTVLEITGSVLFAGPFTNLLFHGVDVFLKLNCFLGNLLPSLASGFFIACKVSKTE